MLDKKSAAHQGPWFQGGDRQTDIVTYGLNQPWDKLSEKALPKVESSAGAKRKLPQVTMYLLFRKYVKRHCSHKNRFIPYI